jgi:hypothetical protein
MPCKTLRERRFVEEFIVDLNGRAAGMRVEEFIVDLNGRAAGMRAGLGKNPKSAGEIASKMRKKPHVAGGGRRTRRNRIQPYH